MAEAQELCADADLLLCVGSSLEVYPVAGLPELTLGAGGRVAIVTQGPTPYDDEAAVKLDGDVVTSSRRCWPSSSGREGARGGGPVGRGRRKRGEPGRPGDGHQQLVPPLLDPALVGVTAAARAERPSAQRATAAQDALAEPQGLGELGESARS